MREGRGKASESGERIASRHCGSIERICLLRNEREDRIGSRTDRVWVE